MRLMDISYLKGSDDILKDYPHLKDAQVNDVFDRISQKPDGSFVLKGDHPKFWAINIEDGRQNVWSNPDKLYCQAGETPEKTGCVLWYGDKENGVHLFKPGPNPNAGKVEYINWEEATKPPSKWVWFALGILLWLLLKK